MVLGWSEVTEIPLDSELAFVRKYLDIQRVRHGDRLSVSIEVTPGLLSARVPTLVLQPLVENAVTHGIAPRAAGGRVTIHGVRRGDRLRLEVCDDGVGLPGDFALGHGDGVGLGNTRARLREQYGAAQTLEVRPAPGTGTLVAVEIPLSFGDGGAT